MAGRRATGRAPRGAPLRFSPLGGGYGGHNEDHGFFGHRRSG